MVIVVISRDCRKILVPYRVWPASPTESVRVKRTDVRRTEKVGYHQVTPAGATCFWQKTLAFYFSEFSKFLAFFWGES